MMKSTSCLRTARGPLRVLSHALQLTDVRLVHRILRGRIARNHNNTVTRMLRHRERQERRATIACLRKTYEQKLAVIAHL